MKILALDIETSPTKGYVWSLWGQNVAINQIEEPGKVLCWASQWVGEKKLEYRRVGDKDFLETAHAPPSPIKHIDLLEVAKKQFNFVSNKMQFLLTDLEIGTKLDHEGFPLWIKCLNNDKKAWKVMEAYNKQDVKQLVLLYKRFLPWISNHPNYNLYGSLAACTNCGSTSLQRRGTHPTQVGVYQRFRCNDCGKWLRGRYSEIGKEDRKDILVGAV